MSFTNINAPEKLYYDIQVSNLENTNSLPPLLNFIETRNIPFLYECDKYLMSIIRFSLDTPNLPVFIPSIQPAPNTNPNLTIYSVSLKWTNPIAPFQTFVQQTYITYSPQNEFAEIPPNPSQTPNGLQYNLSGYYNVNNYQYFIYLINNAFTTCFNALNAQVVASGLVLPTIHAPVLSWNTGDSTAVLNADILGYDTASSNYIEIYFNTPLYQLFTSFPVLLKTPNDPNGLNIQIITDTFSNSNVIQYPPVAPTYTALQVFQEFSTVSVWNPLTSIVFTSNTLPIISNQVSSPVIYNNGVQLGNNGNNALINQIITDFVSSSGMYKPTLVYNPTAQYRFIELISNRPLNTIDLQVFWKDRYGTLIPFYLSSGSTATIKILFTKKNSSNVYK